MSLRTTATTREASTRAPLILSGPGIAPRKFDRPVSLLDVAPTVVEWAGLPALSRWQGTSLTDLTPAQADARPPKRFFDGHPAYATEKAELAGMV